MPDPATAQQRAADHQAMSDQIRALLGDSRFREYQLAQDMGYRAAMEIVAHYKLPAANAAETYTLQQSIMSRMQEINRNAGGDRTAAAPQIAALVGEANAELTRLLGPGGADAYKKTGGAWLRSLERGPPPATSRAP